MELMKDASSTNHELDVTELRGQVVRELRSLLESVPEVDLATVYRTIVGLLGADAVSHIAEAVASGIRAGRIELEPRVVDPRCPAVAFIRRAGRFPAAA